MDVSQTVLNNVALYMQWRQAQDRANMLEDQLTAVTPHMSQAEKQTYEHITGMYEVGRGTSYAIPIPTERLAPLPAED